MEEAFNDIYTFLIIVTSINYTLYLVKIHQISIINTVSRNGNYFRIYLPWLFVFKLLYSLYLADLQSIIVFHTRFINSIRYNRSNVEEYIF